MKNSNKKGFTIVELVIVIAVIAILAAVLIPTFSSLVKKANLSSDKQAVREMNIALKASEAKNGKPENIDQAMKVIADAGYDVDAWNPLTAGYQVYWFITDNVCVLYSTTEGIEFPENYTNVDMLSTENAGKFFVYNQTFKKAQEKDFTYNSSSAKDITINGKTYNSAVEVKSDTAAGSKAYASVVIEEKADKSKTYNVATVIANDATVAQKSEAAKAAGEYVYALFTQMNLDMISKDSDIIIADDTEIDVSGVEWKPVRLLTGYFGSKNPDKPAIINGLSLSNALAYTETYTFRGSSSLYYTSGFIGAVCGTATVENLTFKNLKIENPAADCILLKEGNNSNTTAIIGGIVRDTKSADGATNVTIKNIKAENVNVTGKARVGGIVGFIGGYKNETNYTYGLTGSVTIEGCSFNGNVVSELNTTSYGTAGTIVGFVDKIRTGQNKYEVNKVVQIPAGELTNDFVLNIKDCEVAGSVKGFYAGGLIGEVTSSGPKEINLENIKSTVTVSANSSSEKAKTGGVVVNTANGKVPFNITNVEIGGEKITTATEALFGIDKSDPKNLKPYTNGITFKN